eukprot:1161842-Pelagomonas_calceolata.AAC.4
MDDDDDALAHLELVLACLAHPSVFWCVPNTLSSVPLCLVLLCSDPMIVNLAKETPCQGNCMHFQAGLAQEALHPTLAPGHTCLSISSSQALMSAPHLQPPTRCSIPPLQAYQAFY